MTTQNLVTTKTAAALLGVCEGKFRQMEKEHGFERLRQSPNRFKFSWSEILEKTCLTREFPEFTGTVTEDSIFVDQKEAARRLGITTNTFRRQAARVGLTRHKIGKRGVRYRWGEVYQKLAQVEF